MFKTINPASRPAVQRRSAQVHVPNGSRGVPQVRRYINDDRNQQQLTALLQANGPHVVPVPETNSAGAASLSANMNAPGSDNAPAKARMESLPRTMQALRNGLGGLVKGHRTEMDNRQAFLSKAMQAIAAALGLDGPGLAITPAAATVAGIRKLHFDGSNVLVSTMTAEACNDTAVFEQFLREAVEWGFIHALFGADAAIAGRDQLNPVQCHALDTMMNQLYQFTLPSDPDEKRRQAAARALQQATLQVTITQNSSVDVYCDPAALRRELVALDLQYDVPAATQDMRLFWNAVRRALDNETRDLFDHFNCGLTPPASAAELEARLNSFGYWLRESGGTG